MTANEWAQANWEPVGGCTRASEGCRHCYAERLIGTRLATNPSTRGRYDGLTRPSGFPGGGPRFTGLLSWWPERLAEPLSRRMPTRYFVCSQSDLFHNARNTRHIIATLGVCVAAGWHTFLLLTKRPAIMRSIMTTWSPKECVTAALEEARRAGASRAAVKSLRSETFRPERRWGDLPHIWWGVSVENQENADARIPVLLQVPAAVRFVSYEPALGPVDFWAISDGSRYDSEGATRYNALTGAAWWGGTGDHGIGGGPRIDWIIAGAESGPGARPAPLDWVRSVRDQVLTARGGRETPLPGDPHLFLKQWDVCAMCNGNPGEDPCNCERVILEGPPIPPGSSHGGRDISGKRSTAWTGYHTGQTGKVRKGCPALDGRVWNEIPEVTR